nr:mucin-5AC [Drosophila suzukii]
MKFAIALCLLLATSGFAALVPTHPADLVSMLARQQFAVRSMMAAPEARDESTLINDCFSHYMEDQTNVIISYNQQYTGCLRTAQSGRDELTQESASERQALLDRTNNMCTSLTKCDEKVDGLEFFDCYRNASSDSYRVMFTLNSDSSLDYNRISARYQVIETDLTDCVDTARVKYAHDMDSCDESLTVCLNGNADADTTPAAPTTTPAAPTTTPAAPTTTPAAPTTTPAPPTTTPAAPTTTPAAPTTTPAAPTTTPAVPTTTPAVPTTTSAVPTTTPAAPTTTAEPTTTPAAPTTTAEPTTTPAAPTTTAEPTTTPAVPTTEAPEVATTERSPEEDLNRSAAVAHKRTWNLFKRFF